MKAGGVVGLFALVGILFASRRARAASVPGGGWGSVILPPAPDPWQPEAPDYEPDLSPGASKRPAAYISSADRDRKFGPLTYVASPTSSNPEAISITNGFANKLVSHYFPELGRSITIHPAAIAPLEDVLDELDSRGMLGLIRTFDGSYNPRLVRGSTSSLSSHAYATSLDLNARENPLGSGPTADQTRLAEVFERHGWYWGNRFTRPDPMHFEWIG